MPNKYFLALSVKKINAPTPSTCQIPLIQQLAMGFHVCFPPSMLGFGLAWACMDLVHASTIAVSSYVRQRERESQLRMVWAFESPKPTPGDTTFTTRLHFLILPKQFHQQWTKHSVYEPMRVSLIQTNMPSKFCGMNTGWLDSFRQFGD